MYFTLRGKLPKKTSTVIAIAGTVVFLGAWTAITETGLIPKSILPSPLKVLVSFKELHFNDALVRNALFSLMLNFLGLIEATALAIPLGFVIGLFPAFRALTEGYITAGRFIPLTAVVGVFIAWFGIEVNMKVQFLAFSIFLFLLPVVIQKVDEIEEVYVQTVVTLGASKWQIIKIVFIPAVVSRVFDSIRVLAALSWTYIVVAEMVNANGGGVGALSYIAARQSRIDKVFAILLTIILIGFIQDRILLLTDRLLFPYKYIRK
jgi:NitT/TauT family transport system permease protein